MAVLQKSLHPCAFDESLLIIGRVNHLKAARIKANEEVEEEGVSVFSALMKGQGFFWRLCVAVV